MREIRTLLIIEAVAFALASLTHLGVLIDGLEDPGAGTAEGVIGAVLAAGLVATFALPAWTRAIGLVVQGFALAGTSIGLYLVLRGIGPNTVPDVVFHVGIFAFLVLGLVVTARLPRDRARGSVDSPRA